MIQFYLLEKFGTSNHPFQVNENLYKNFKIELKIGKCNSLIDYTAGVK